MDVQPEVSEEEDFQDDDTCSFCGIHEYDPDNMKCPECRSCSGVYSPGTEECDWCPESEICESEAH